MAVLVKNLLEQHFLSVEGGLGTPPQACPPVSPAPIADLDLTAADLSLTPDEPRATNPREVARQRQQRDLQENLANRDTLLKTLAWLRDKGYLRGRLSVGEGDDFLVLIGEQGTLDPIVEDLCWCGKFRLCYTDDGKFSPGSLTVIGDFIAGSFERVSHLRLPVFPSGTATTNRIYLFELTFSPPERRGFISGTPYLGGA